MRYALLLALAAITGADESSVTNLVALVLSLGTAVAGVAAFLRLRLERPKVVEEVAGLAERRLRDELATAWDALDRERLRAREREQELEEAVAGCQRHARDLTERVAELERLIEQP